MTEIILVLLFQELNIKKGEQRGGLNLSLESLMYIEPNSTIKLYKGVPLSSDYQHTIYFSSKTSQTSYFHSGGATLVATLSKYSYQRKDKGTILIALPIVRLATVNYMAFMNESYENKWIYAFVEGVEYVNNETTKIIYTIDSLQTYMTDMTLKPCFIERTHTKTDVRGEHTQPEPVDGVEICREIASTGLFDEYSASVCLTTESQGIVSGLPTGCIFQTFRITSTYLPAFIKFLNEKISAGKADQILGITLFPTSMTTALQSDEPYSVNFKYTIPTKVGQNYTPRNKKLLTYPYSYLTVESDTDSAIYKYELFTKDDNRLFKITGVGGTNPQITCNPQGYNMGIGMTTENKTDSVVMSSFPQVAFGSDTFKEWMSTQGVYSALNTITGVIGGGAQLVGGATSVLAGNVVGGSMGALNGLNTIANNINPYIQQSRKPPTVHGSSVTSVAVARKTLDFYFKQMTINDESAKAIDDFFDVYGYAYNRVEVPTLSNRPHWTFVKTSNCNVTGDIPNSDVVAIQNIFNNGITFWKNASEVGNYKLDNRV